MLLVTGRLNIDITVYLSGELELHAKNVAMGYKEFLGGSGSNAAVAAARILGPGKVYMLGAVGRDRFGDIHIEALRDEGVDTKLVFRVDAPSGIAVVLVEKHGLNTIVSIPGANAMLRRRAVEERLGVLRRMKGFVVMNPPAEVAELLIETASANHALLFLDPGRGLEGLVTRLGRGVGDCFYLPNEQELLSVTGTRSLYRAVERLGSSGFECQLVVKRGEKGVLYIEPGSRVVAVSSLPLEVLGLEPVNTAGCGDALTGVFAAYVVMGRPIEESLLYASVASSINASKPSPRSVPKRKELEELASEALAQGLIEVRELPYHSIRFM